LAPTTSSLLTSTFAFQATTGHHLVLSLPVTNG
jgi:hypothetical protein